MAFAVSSSVATVCAVATGASFTGVNWIALVALAVVVDEPSLTVVVSVLFAVLLKAP
jgi:hypothetical protein